MLKEYQYNVRFGTANASNLSFSSFILSFSASVNVIIACTFWASGLTTCRKFAHWICSSLFSIPVGRTYICKHETSFCRCSRSFTATLGYLEPLNSTHILFHTRLSCFTERLNAWVSNMEEVYSNWSVTRPVVLNTGNTRNN